MPISRAFAFCNLLLVMKMGEYEISKEYAYNMKNKMVMFRKHGLKRTQKGELKMVFLTTYGLVRNSAYNALNISGELTIDDLL
jgi:hypothetical protein